MTLAETLQSKLGDWRPDGPGRHTLTQSDPDSGWKVSLEIERNEPLSCALAELTCEHTGEPLSTTAWAGALEKRIRGLMEPLRLIEADAARDEAVLRSALPTVRGEKRSHYELRLTGGRKASLKRYAAAIDPTAKRQATPFVLTHEVLGQLIDDLTAPLN